MNLATAITITFSLISLASLAFGFDITAPAAHTIPCAFVLAFYQRNVYDKGGFNFIQACEDKALEFCDDQGVFFWEDVQGAIRDEAYSRLPRALIQETVGSVREFCEDTLSYKGAYCVKVYNAYARNGGQHPDFEGGLAKAAIPYLTKEIARYIKRWNSRPARENQPAPDYARAMKALDQELATPLYTRLRAVIEANEATANERRILARRVSSSPYYQAAVNAVFAEAIARNSYGPRTAELCSFTKRDLANQWAEELYSAYLRHGGYNTPGFSRAAAMVAKSALYNAVPRFITKKMWPAKHDAIKGHLWADYDRLADEVNALNSGCIVS